MPDNLDNFLIIEQKIIHLMLKSKNVIRDLLDNRVTQDLFTSRHQFLIQCIYKEYLDNMGRGDDVDVLDYFDQIWEEITDLKEKYSTYSFNQCLKDSRTFIDFFDTLVSVHVNIDDFDFKNCPDVGDELNDIERKKYNKLVNDLYNRWKQTYGDDKKPGTC